MLLCWFGLVLKLYWLECGSKVDMYIIEEWDCLFGKIIFVGILVILGIIFDIFKIVNQSFFGECFGDMVVFVIMVFGEFFDISCVVIEFCKIIDEWVGDVQKCLWD